MEPEKQPSKNGMVIGIVIIIIVIIGFWAYKSSTSTEGTTGNETAVPTDSTSVATTSDASTNLPTETKKMFVVSGTNFSFTPNSITVNKGDTVVIQFKNTGGSHDFVIDEFNVRTKRINGGQEETVEFTADKSGTFEYYCSVGTHRAMGMKGTLTVN